MNESKLLNELFEERIDGVLEVSLDADEDYQNSIKKVFDYQKRGIYHSAYEEMKITYYQIESGLPEGKAYQIFGKRCRMHRYRKLGNMLEQNIRKGTAGLLEELKQEVQEALGDRKALTFRMGEEASTKLLMPMILLLGIVLIICIAPALMTF